MPATTTQAPAPVVRRAPKTSSPQPIVPNADGSLPRALHEGEYQDSYPVTRPAPRKTVPATQVPTTNPLTSLTSQGATAPAKTQAGAKGANATQAGKPKASTATATHPAASTSGKPAVVNKAAAVQTPGQLLPGPFNRTTIMIDPAHGGNDVGARITDSILEKDIDLQFAFKLRSLLAARGFNVVLTRDSDAANLPDKPDSPLTLDVRAGIANRQQAVACLLLHSTGSGHGVHLYASELTPVPAEPYAAPWLTAQNGWVSQSLLLEKQIGRALARANFPLVVGRASVRPVDSLTCPALVIELAPESGDPASISNDSYQQQAANAIATALIFWQNSAQPPPRLAPPVYKAPAPVEKPETEPTENAPATTPPVVQP